MEFLRYILGLVLLTQISDKEKWARTELFTKVFF